MSDRLRARTNGYTVTPGQYVVLAYVALGALTLIVLSGAAVRLTGSGLGCPTWPKCYGHLYPPLKTHAVIEFSNRVVSVPVVLATGLAWLGALRRRPYRRDLVWLAALLPLGVVAQAVLGGLTVRGKLDYGWVMAHFALSMLILVAAAALAWRAGRNGDRDRPRAGDRQLVWWARALVGMGALTIFAGTAATAAGPHAGGNPGEHINRLNFDGRGTMDFVIHRHAEIAFVFGLLAVWVWWLTRRRAADPVMRRAATALCVLLALQGVVGIDQYETHLPTELVWVHVALACGCWLAALWTAYAAGRLPERVAEIDRPQGRATEADRPDSPKSVLAGR
ncbi:MAG TPA: COX15/CtaA family protein [Solirubrobacteraceae bacterium]|jgi:cytochrome c oxidase assembly protein subunit 15|nr:COX15/CtaA family protein [Solirubrobacteraceae bacterium]